MRYQSKLNKLQEIVGHSFSDSALALRALTHPSAVEGHAIHDSYERLEFLGDSILGSIVACDLFERFPEMDEGALTRLKISLVSGAMLSHVSRDAGIDQCIIFGESERGSGSRGMRSALENVFEAIVGALYLDAGYEKAQSFVRCMLGPHMHPSLASHPENPKSLLQEIVQHTSRNAPVYKLIDETGPDHAPTFTSVVLIENVRSGKGSGSSKKESEFAAARDAMSRMGYDPETGAQLSDAQAPSGA